MNVDVNLHHGIQHQNIGILVPLFTVAVLETWTSGRAL